MKIAPLFQTTLLGLAAAATLIAGDSPSTADVKAVARPVIPRRPDNALQIVSPIHGEQVGPRNGMAHITVGKEIDVSTLRIFINGKDMTLDAGAPRCGLGFRVACDINIRLKPENGVQEGQNRMRVVAVGKDKHVESTKVKFHYKSGNLLAASDGDHYLPDTVGLKLNPGGALPWATITTGYPAGVTDPSAASLTTPYRDASFPSQDQACASEPLQVLVMSRKNPLDPNHPPTFTCVPDVATLKQILSDSTRVTVDNIVIAGTTVGHVAPAGLNTSAIGGADYSTTSASLYPQGYVVIGVPGASAGTAYENYFTLSDLPTAIGGYAPWAHGTLASDGGAYYNFISSDNRVFTITPNDPSAGTSVVTVASRTFTAPQGSENGFWLLVLEGGGLQPIDGVADPNAPCSINAQSLTACGTFFPTGSANSGTATDAVNRLASALSNVTARQLAFLTSVGQPFQTPVLSTMGALGTALTKMGGSKYTLGFLAAPGSTYSLVAPGVPANGPAVRMPFGRDVFSSTSAHAAQGQSGNLTGILAQRHDGTFAPLTATQVDGKQNGNNATVVTPDLTLYTIVGRDAEDWLLTETPGRWAAYHYVSQWVLQNTYGLTGPFSQDIRYFYSDLTHDQIWTRGLLNCQLDSTKCPSYPTGNNPQFSPEDLQDAITVLYNELLALDDSHAILDDGQTSIRTLLSGTGSNLATEMISATHTVVDGQLQAAQNSPVKMKPSDWLALAGGITSLASGGLEDAVPVIGDVLGTLSGLLSLGGSIDSPFEDKATPTAYTNGFDTTLAELSEKASDYTTGLVRSYDTSLETLYSDSGRLGAIRELTNTGWGITNLVGDTLASNLSSGVSRSLYTQLMPQVYSLDAYPSQPVRDVTKIGTFYQNLVGEVTCTATHSSLPDGNYYTIVGVGWPAGEDSSPYDIYVLAGFLQHQGDENVSEQLPSQELLDVLVGPPSSDSGAVRLNLPRELIVSGDGNDGGFLPFRAGPDQGFTKEYGQCYKPGCTSNTLASPNPFAACKGPEK